MTPTDPRAAAIVVDEDPTSSLAIPRPTPTKHAVASFAVEPGVMLGEYRIEDKIGEGSTGTVFAGVHPVIGKRVAIKVLKRAFCEDTHTVERFIDEARVVNQIQHPNIVDIFAFGEMPDGRRYLVMELLQGTTLKACIQRGRPALEDAIGIIKALARALEAAHAKGVIHRDLKPDNVFLVELTNEPVRVKLLDFGLAKLRHEEHRATRTATGALVGTPQYVSPEQAKGQSVDERADIYSLGGIAFELLTGRPPFEADSAMEMVAKQLMEQPTPPSLHGAEIPQVLDDIVFAMLCKDAAGRPTLDELIAVLDQVRDTPVAARPTPKWNIERSSAKLPKRPPRPAPAVTTKQIASPSTRWWAIGLVLAIAGAGIAAMIFASRWNDELPHAITKQTPAPVGSAAPAAPAPVAAAAVEPAPPTTQHVAPVADPPARSAPPPKARTVAKKPQKETPRKPEPATAAPPADGKLLVVLHGAKGAIAVDGKTYGSSLGQALITLPAGVHKLSVKFPNEEERVETVQVRPTDTTRREIKAAFDDGPKGEELMNPTGGAKP